MYPENFVFFKNAFFFLFEKRFSPLQFCLTVVQIKVLLVQNVILLTLDTSQKFIFAIEGGKKKESKPGIDNHVTTRWK